MYSLLYYLYIISTCYCSKSNKSFFFLKKSVVIKILILYTRHQHFVILAYLVDGFILKLHLFSYIYTFKYRFFFQSENVKTYISKNMNLLFGLY